MKELKDYLHLYLGCEVKFPKSQSPKTNGVVKCDAECIHDLHEYGEWEYCKPILRPLSDMTQDEADVIWGILDWNERITGVARITDIIREFDVIEEDNDTTSNAHWGYLCKILPYLLKYGFDLFGLIDAGLAIDKTTLNQ